MQTEITHRIRKSFDDLYVFLDFAAYLDSFAGARNDNGKELPPRAALEMTGRDARSGRA